MSINLQYAEVAMLFRNCPVKTERDTMIAAKQTYQFVFAKQGTCLIIHPTIEIIAPAIDIFQRFRHELVGRNIFSS